MLIKSSCFQDEKEKPTVPVVHLNVIRLLADLNVTVNKCEMVDMILPLFIAILEEGDASTPSSLRLQVWNFVFGAYTLELLCHSLGLAPLVMNYLLLL